MAPARTIQMVDGETSVLVPKDAYDAVMHALEVAEASLAAARIKRGDDETFPDAVVARLIDGERPTKVYREHRGLTQSELAAKAGVDLDLIVALEEGNSPLKSLAAIARALSVDLDDLVDA